LFSSEIHNITATVYADYAVDASALSVSLIAAGAVGVSVFAIPVIRLFKCNPVI
jgi:hypothetical protein